MHLKRRSAAWLLKEKIIVPLSFLLFLITAIFIYNDYGLAWDAAYTRERGLLNYNYVSLVFNNVEDETERSEILQAWNNYPYHDHGAFFDLLATSAEKAFSVSNTREAYLLRHFLIFLLFFTGCLFFYLILRKRLGWYYALTGVLFLVLSPRIFGHAFFNPKDIIFMVLSIISLYTAIRFLSKPSYLNALTHALSSAVAIDIRITGLFIPAVTLLLIVFLMFTHRARIKHLLLKTGVYLILLPVFVVAFWPHLWADPLNNIIAALQSMSSYNWDDPVLYRGEFIKAPLLPWHYPFVWIAISTPLLYLILFIPGLYFEAKNKVSDKVWAGRRISILVLLWFFAPLLAIMVLNPTLYDGWRQLYFLYPPLLIVALTGAAAIMKHSAKPLKIILVLLISINSLYLIYNMAKLHPFQHLYFNALAGKHPERNYDLDYWGLSYRDTYEKLLDQTDEESISFVPANNAGFVNLEILAEDQKQRLNPMSWDSAKYFITNYRWVYPQKVEKANFPYDKEILVIERCGIRVAGVYKIR